MSRDFEVGVDLVCWRNSGFGWIEGVDRVEVNEVRECESRGVACFGLCLNGIILVVGLGIDRMVRVEVGKSVRKLL